MLLLNTILFSLLRRVPKYKEEEEDDDNDDDDADDNDNTDASGGIL